MFVVLMGVRATLRLGDDLEMGPGLRRGDIEGVDRLAAD
jgi:hypothetical protein